MNYTNLASTADSLLGQFGTPVKLLRNGASLATANAVFTTSKAQDDTTATSALLAQTSVRKRTVLLSGLSKEPMVGDTLTADKDSWVVQSVEKVRPALTTVLYKLEIA